MKYVIDGKPYTKEEALAMKIDGQPRFRELKGTTNLWEIEERRSVPLGEMKAHPWKRPAAKVAQPIGMVHGDLDGFQLTV